MEEVSRESLDKLRDWMSNISPGTANEMAAQAKFLWAQTVLQMESTQAAKDASKAAQETAAYTKQNARYMLWSVVVLTISSVVTAAISFWKCN